MVLFLLQVAAPHVLEQEGLGHVDAGESLAVGVRLLSVDIRHKCCFGFSTFRIGGRIYKK